jgi:hypothetical protein
MRQPDRGMPIRGVFLSLFSYLAVLLLTAN